MAFVSVPNAAKAVVRFAAPQGIWTNTFWFQKILFTLEEQEALASAVDVAWGSSIADAISSQHTYVETVVYDMREADGLIVINSDSTATGSDTATGPIPISAAMVLSLYSANRGRSGRGRVFVTGFTESKWTTTGFEAASITAIENAYTAMSVSALAVGWTPCILSRQINGVVRTTPLMQAIVSSEVRTGREGVQRRRVNRG